MASPRLVPSSTAPAGSDRPDRFDQEGLVEGGSGGEVGVVGELDQAHQVVVAGLDESFKGRLGGFEPGDHRAVFGGEVDRLHAGGPIDQGDDRHPSTSHPDPPPGGLGATHRHRQADDRRAFQHPGEAPEEPRPRGATRAKPLQGRPAQPRPSGGPQAQGSTLSRIRLNQIGSPSRIPPPPVPTLANSSHLVYNLEGS